ncbi:ubiquitin-like protein ATG12 [Paraphoma chrysanthemicola]|uniref:Ubiquitin-like protein ATG12 n=1 Tax=Paraphoma chrysanthemicola TaxID=798071 RepID=A0A8K0RCI0_9PLEO|nr:ubiquitin-like protein ATG12 [Paraphoma chrysanthemicola]
MSSAPEERIPEDDETTEAPLTMAASVVLTNLPRDASRALETAGNLTVQKITVRLQPIGSAPHLNQRVFKLSTNQRFETIVKFLRKKLGVKEHESVFCYVGSVFSPALDEGVGNLWTCFKQNDELVVGYAMSPAFG